jgi:hypothetical protein
VEFAAEVHFALDIEHPAVASADARGDPARLAEARHPDLVDGERIDLSDALARCVDHDDAILDTLAHALRQAAVAALLGIERHVDVCTGDDLGLRRTRIVVGLARDIDEVHHLHRELPRIPSEPRPMLDQA